MFHLPRIRVDLVNSQTCHRSIP